MSSRSRNTFYNTTFSSISQVINLAVSYGTRIVFARVLGASFLGLESLFASIVGVLSIIDLGLTTVMYYKLYAPLKDRDESLTAAYVSYFQKIFSGIGVGLLLLSLAFSPFVSGLIRENSFASNQLSLYFLMYALYSFSSYFFIHSRSLLYADQSNYIVSIIELITRLFTRGLQVFFLLKSGNFAFYLALEILYSLLSNGVITAYAKRKYPFLKARIALSQPEKKSVLSDVKWQSISKVANVGVGSTDSIIISYFLGAAILGVYSNYYMLISALFGLFSIPINSIMPSFANLVQYRETKKIADVFRTYGFVSYLIASLYAVVIAIAIQDLIVLSFGADFLLSDFDVYIVCANYFLMLILAPVWNAISIEGLFQKALPLNLIQFGVNIVVSIVLVLRIGLTGVFLGTFVSILVSYSAAVVLLSRKVDYLALGRYFRRMLVFIALSVLTVFLCRVSLFRLQFNHRLIQMAVRLLLSALLFFVVNFLAFHRSEEWKSVVAMLKRLFSHRMESEETARPDE